MLQISFGFTPVFKKLATMIGLLSLILANVVNAQTLSDELSQGLGLTRPAQQTQMTEAASTDNLLSAPNNEALSLSEQIESLKQAMVNLNRDLFILEEDLLFPVSTQVAVYLSMDVGEYFALDAVEIRIDNKVATHYLYTDRQVNALYRGGMQRLYLGNVNQGEHELSAYFIGIGPEKREYKRAVSVTFTKDEDPVAIELSVIDSTAKQQPVFEAKVL